MAEQKTFIAALVVIIIILAAALLVTQLPGITGSSAAPDQGVTTTPTATPTADTNMNGNGGETAAAAITTDVNAITTVRVSADAVDWDATPGVDGYVVHYACFDRDGTPVSFSGERLSTTVYAYTPDTDVNKNPISPQKIIFKGYTIITSSADGNPGNTLAGIYMPFRDMTMAATDRGVGKITLILKLPGGSEVTGSTSYLFPK